MNLLTLELTSKTDLELLIAFAKRLNAKILQVSDAKSLERESPVNWLDFLAKNGGVQSISDPSVWQNDIRTDKKLINRE